MKARNEGNTQNLIPNFSLLSHFLEILQKFPRFSTNSLDSLEIPQILYKFPRLSRNSIDSLDTLHILWRFSRNSLQILQILLRFSWQKPMANQMAYKTCMCVFSTGYEYNKNWSFYPVHIRLYKKFKFLIGDPRPYPNPNFGFRVGSGLTILSSGFFRSGSRRG